MKSTVEIFATLASRLRAIPRSVVDRAQAENSWFTCIDIALDAIVSQMLDSRKIEQWLGGYTIEPHTPKRVAVIMAGNIPAVGFADLMYVIASGNIPVVKYSSKDRVLMDYIVGALLDIEPALTIEQYNDTSALDALIATGSDTAALHFRALFGNLPTLIRGSRHSVAVLTGNESAAELEGLAADIFTHSGLGCRNVSLIFAPEGYDFSLSVPPMPQGYQNNYLHTRALMIMRSEPFKDGNGALFVESDAAFPKSLSCINICRYSSIEEPKLWLKQNDSRLQCVVSSVNGFPRRVDFGCAQYPTLNDYADDVDVMKFLLTL